MPEHGLQTERAGMRGHGGDHFRAFLPHDLGEISAVRHAEHVNPIGVDAVIVRQLRQQCVEHGQIGPHLLRPQAPTAVDGVRIGDDEVVLAGRFVELRVLGHEVFRVDQHAVKCDHQRRRFGQIDRVGHDETINASHAADVQGLGGKFPMLRLDGLARGRKAQQTAECDHHGRHERSNEIAASRHLRIESENLR